LLGYKIACVALILAACGGSSAAGTTMQTRGTAFAPPAFKSFCARQKALCSTSGKSKVVELTAARKAELKAVNAAVNRRVAQRSDLATTGKADSWNLPMDQGDCEDIAILKKSELIKLGWTASTLLLTVARSGNEGHTVLTVRTSDGDLVLDNRTSAIRDWARTPYRYFARQSQSNGAKWERIGAGVP
jgi:predicted transglutaminase-like cysteine proteinase